MVDGGGLAVGLFAVGGLVLVVSGVYLAVRSMRLASLLGVGGVLAGGLVGAMAVSLPEITSGLAAGMLEVPALGLGTAVPLVSLLFNLMIFALAFGLLRGRSALTGLSSGYGGLAVLGFCLAGLLVLLGLFRWDAGVWHVGLGTVLLLLVYVGGLVWVSRVGAEATRTDGGWPGYGFAAVTWLLVWASVVGLVLGSYLLLDGAGRLAGAMAVSGVLAVVIPVAALMSLPEAVVAVWALRGGRSDYAAGVLLGSCCLNVLAVCLADLFLKGGVVFVLLGNVHLVAAGFGSVLLLCLGWALCLRGRESGRGAGVVMGAVAALSALGLAAAVVAG